MIHVIRNKEKPWLFWSNEQGWVDQSDARVFGDLTKAIVSLPMDGEWVECTSSKGVLEQINETVAAYRSTPSGSMREVQGAADNTITKIEELVRHGLAKCLEQEPVRVVVEVSGGLVSGEYGNADVVVCDWDNITSGDDFELADDWLADPYLKEFVEGSYQEVVGLMGERNALCECGKPIKECGGKHPPQQGDGCPECPSMLVLSPSGTRVFCRGCGWSHTDVIEKTGEEDDDG